MNIGSHSRPIDQLLDTAKPTGWNGNQPIFMRSELSRIVIANPTTIAIAALMSGGAGDLDPRLHPIPRLPPEDQRHVRRPQR